MTGLGLLVLILAACFLCFAYLKDTHAAYLREKEAYRRGMNR